ncbi:GH25 family lysozyme [Enterococcus faecalis]
MKSSAKLFVLGIGLTFGGLITSIPAEAKNIVTSNYELGSFAQNDSVNHPLLRSKRSLSETPPRVDFIDISSHNGEISVEQFQKMKNMGIKGVVVKLTEGTTYKNPFILVVYNLNKVNSINISEV